ncbi:redoxin domain-containing protein, partial [uncultured Helicobacter sp.]|uniref:TlpA family protein disulfide reductase n=3 Tax=uncultured Helicobacter sp. TaxID=175537 RepID=UPI00261DF564
HKWRQYKMKMAQILKRWQSFTKLFILAVMICWAFQACSDDVDKDKDIFGFEGGSKDKILSIEVMNTQNESLRFKTNESQSIFQTDTQRPTLLFFLSKSCQECQDELLHILDLYNKYQEFISIIAISPRDELEHLQKEIDLINPRFKLYAPTDNKNLLNFLNKDEKQSYIALYDRQGEKVIDYVGLVPEEMVELDIQYQIQDQLDAKAQYEMQSLTPEEQEELENANTGQEAQ